MIIDTFCHIYPFEFLKAHAAQIQGFPRFLDVRARQNETYFTDDEERIRYMDKLGVDVEVLTLAYGEVWDSIRQENLARFTRLANDSLYKLVGKHPGRMVGIATLPVPEGEALDELSRCIEQLGMRGCMIFSNIRGRPLDSPEFIPFYERMARYDLPIFIHPTSWSYYNWGREYRLVQIFGWPFDTTFAMGRLVFGGVLERFPNLKIVIHHLGAMIPFFSGRIRGMYDEEVARFPDSASFPYAQKMRLKNKHPLDYFKSFYADTAISDNLSALRCAYDFYGPDHILYASDYPYGPGKGELWTAEIINNVKNLDVSEEERSKIFEKNARRILRLQ